MDDDDDEADDKDDAVENEDDDDAFAGVSDIDSSASNFGQEDVSSTVAALATTTTLSVSTTSISSSGNTSTPAAHAPTEKVTRSTSPSEWSVEDVIEFIAETDPALSIYAELFRKHVSSRIIRIQRPAAVISSDSNWIFHHFF